MEYAISQIAIIPLRAEPAERAEMSSQILFGETYQILERGEKFARVLTDHDGYEGYVSNVQIVTISQEEHEDIQQQPYQLTIKPVTVVIRNSDKSALYLPACSKLLSYKDGIAIVNKQSYTVSEEVGEVGGLVSTAKAYLNAPYIWGARTHFGIDCSGFAQAVFKQHGIFLRRDASMQAEQGRAVDFLQEARAGDLAFFDNDEGRITHVGIMLNNEQIIHASGRVKIDRIDNQGIYSDEFQRYTHKLRIIKRFS
jgi:cell wall-associated NlpC family hydrolase